MKSCIACNAEIEEEYNFCKICGSNQNVQPNNLIKSDTTFLTILCVLTIIGSLLLFRHQINPPNSCSQTQKTPPNCHS